MIIRQRLRYTVLTVILLFTAICILINLSGCEGMACAEGTIYDKSTEEPLDSVQCKVLTAENQIGISDSIGHYDVCNDFGGCVPDCPDIVLNFQNKVTKQQKLKTHATNNQFILKWKIKAGGPRPV